MCCLLAAMLIAQRALALVLPLLLVFSQIAALPLSCLPRSAAAGLRGRRARRGTPCRLRTTGSAPSGMSMTCGSRTQQTALSARAGGTSASAATAQALAATAALSCSRRRPPGPRVAAQQQNTSLI